MFARGSGRLVRLAGFVLWMAASACVTVGPGPAPQATSKHFRDGVDVWKINEVFEIAYSEKLDAATFLNAISDNPRFNGPWAGLGETWQSKLEIDAVTKSAFDRWRGRGIQLAYLLSAIEEDDLEGLLHRMDEPKRLLADINNGLDEPTYRPVFDDLVNDIAGLETIFETLVRAGFHEHWSTVVRPRLDKTRQELSAQLNTLDARRFLSLLEAFSGRRAPDGRIRIYVLSYSLPFSFQLSGFAVGWSTDKGAFDWLLSHELLHKFNPTPENLTAQKQLAEKDEFYREAFDRVYGEFDAGKEEEWVEAASRYMIEVMGTTSTVRNLRMLKFLYYSKASQRYGVPMATIVYSELKKADPDLATFDYNAFISELFASCWTYWLGLVES